MKYIYYTIGIIVLLTVFAAVRFSDLKVEVSETALIINDRIISEKELDMLFKSSQYSNHNADVLDSVIANELLIQEAIKQGISKEENFRESVESFYEQSLIKILIDRKFDSLKPVITQKMVDRYLELSGRDISYTKMVYLNFLDAEQGKIATSETETRNFEDLSAELKYIFVLLDEGQTTEPLNVGTNYACYRLESFKRSSDANNLTDIKKIKDFLNQQQKSFLFAKWMEDLNKKADIRILTDRQINKEVR